MRSFALLLGCFVVGCSSNDASSTGDTGDTGDAGNADSSTSETTPVADDSATSDARASDTSTAIDSSTPTSDADASAPSRRGFPSAAPWLSFYGNATQMGDLAKVADTFRIINLDADPGASDFTAAQITTLKNGGKNRVISYFDVGSCENYRTWWSSAPSGFVSCSANTKAWAGAYGGYPDEQWMNVGDADYQHLLVDHVAPLLAATGIDGFFLDNLEIVEHSATDTNGKCDDACRQGGLDLVRKVREKFPDLLIVMQNATSDVTMKGTTGGVPFPALLDGISHEEVYAPTYDSGAEAELLAWKALGLTPGGEPFWIATEDYVGSCSGSAAAKAAYDKSRANGFSPYATDASAGQQVVCYWPF